MIHTVYTGLILLTADSRPVSPPRPPSQGTLVVKNPPANTADIRDVGLTPGLGDPLEQGVAPTAVFLLGESHGQRGLAATVHAVAQSQT